MKMKIDAPVLAVLVHSVGLVSLPRGLGGVQSPERLYRLLPVERLLPSLKRRCPSIDCWHLEMTAIAMYICRWQHRAVRSVWTKTHGCFLDDSRLSRLIDGLSWLKWNQLLYEGEERELARRNREGERKRARPN